jgi:hypothetical protein
LFVAADVSKTSVGALSDFADAALTRGMVYFCAWGPGSERFEDVVDQTVVGDGSDEGPYEGPGRYDVIMTTSHLNDTLDEALDFFVSWAIPTEGFAPDSDYWIAVTVDNAGWAKLIRERLQRTES